MHVSSSSEEWSIRGAVLLAVAPGSAHIENDQFQIPTKNSELTLIHMSAEKDSHSNANLF